MRNRNALPALDLLVSSSAYGEGFSNAIGEALLAALKAEIKNRNRESRRDPRREWVNEQRGSRTQRDTGTPPYHWKAGRIWRRYVCPANTHTVIPIFMGYAGTVSKFRAVTSGPVAEHCGSVWRNRVTRRWLNNRIGNPRPVDADGETVWTDDDKADLYDARLLMYAAGDEEQPGGYWPKKHTNRNGETTTAPLNGVWQDDASFGYFTGEKPALFIADHPDRDTVIEPQRVMWAQLDMGV